MSDLPSLPRQALGMIMLSSSADFETPLRWGQWCRSLAGAALCGDSLEEFGAEIAGRTIAAHEPGIEHPASGVVVEGGGL